MKFAFAKSLAPIAACAAALMAAAAPSAASADVHWTVNGTFDDGGSLSGFFDINVYGFLSDFDLTTTAVGTYPGFEYTPALKNSGLTWTPANLDRWLTGPQKVVPGTAMTAVVPDAHERSDLIAYLLALR